MTIVVNLFIVVAGMVIIVSLVKSTFPDFLHFYLNLDYLLSTYIYIYMCVCIYMYAYIYIHTHTYTHTHPDTLIILYDSVIAECIFFFF